MRAQRRHHRERLIAKYTFENRTNRFECPNHTEWAARNARMRANTKTLCSCSMCASPRKFYGNGKGAMTLQEVKHSLWEEDLE